MKIVQSSNIYLGKSFSGTSFHGEKLRSIIKSAFTGIIDIARERSADLVILAGDTFDNLDVSQNLLDFFLEEIRRLEQTPVVIIPGSSDPFSKESFWEQWRISPPAANLHILADDESGMVKIPEISCMINGYPSTRVGILKSWPEGLDRDKKYDYHIAVIYGDVSAADDVEFPVSYERLSSSPFEYIALGGRTGCARMIEGGMKAAYSGAPVTLSPDWNDSGFVLLTELEGESVKVEQVPLEGVKWNEVKISMDTIANIDDLKSLINKYVGETSILKVTLSGLALLDAGVNVDHLREELEAEFLHLEFIDQTRVLPDNISEVKVREKTILGQYLKVMVDRLNNSSGPEKKELEESLKVGYSLLSGREAW